MGPWPDENFIQSSCRAHLLSVNLQIWSRRTPGFASSLIYQLVVPVCAQGFSNPCRIITGLPRYKAPVEAVIGLRRAGGGGLLALTHCWVLTHTPEVAVNRLLGVSETLVSSLDQISEEFLDQRVITQYEDFLLLFHHCLSTYFTLTVTRDLTSLPWASLPVSWLHIMLLCLKMSFILWQFSGGEKLNVQTVKVKFLLSTHCSVTVFYSWSLNISVRSYFTILQISGH